MKSHVNEAFWLSVDLVVFAPKAKQFFENYTVNKHCSSSKTVAGHLGADLLSVGIYAPRRSIVVTIIRQWRRYEFVIQSMFLSSI